MTTCDKCGRTQEHPEVTGFITGKLESTKKTTTLCIKCFRDNYKLKKGVKTNVFVKKGGS